MRRLTVQVLGPFAVSIDDLPVTGFDYAKVRALLAYLAIEHHHPHSRATLATLLWPDQSERHARGSLSQALTTLRIALGDKHAAEPVLLSDSLHVRINPAVAVQVDLTQFLALLAQTDDHSHQSWRTCAACATRLQQALALYRGTFLADVTIPDSDIFEEWAMQQREHLQQRVVSTLERLIEHATWRTLYPEALIYARQLVALDPLLESSQRTLLRLLALNGETVAAIIQYKQVQTVLLRELGIEPEAATLALVAQISRGDTQAFQPPTPRYAVPLAMTPLVGRADAVYAAGAELRKPGTRLLTILGPGGIGKTRLAFAVADTLRYDFEDGVSVLELAALTDATTMIAALAKQFNLKEQPQQSFFETLCEYLRTKHMLLVLDNFEHIIHVAQIVADLLASCPLLRILVTSRTPLSLRAEQQFGLEPLTDADAVKLFIERAQAAGANIALDEKSIAQYATICQRVDRLPLAIELIAGRTRTFTPRELLDQLNQPLQLLTDGPNDLSARHRSLYHAIQWSYDLLDPDQQRVFRVLGLFAGGGTHAAVQAVVGPTLDIGPILAILVQASLVQRQVVAEQSRFVLLETIREFALEQVQHSTELADLYLRHVAYFADFSMTVYRELLRAEASRWQAWTVAELANVRAAFRYALEHQHFTNALQIATGLWRFHHQIGSMREGLEQLEQALRYREHAPLDVQCHALRSAGILSGGLSDYGRARIWFEQAVETGWKVGDLPILQSVLTNFGYTLLEQGELEDARIQLEVSLSLARRASDPTVAKFPLGILAGLYRRLGDYDQAQRLSEENLRLNQQCNDPVGIADSLRTLGSIVLDQGAVVRARELAEAALERHQVLHHQLGVGLDYALLGDIAVVQAAYDQALQFYQRCLAIWRERGNLVNTAMIFDKIAQVLPKLDDVERAATLQSAAVAIRERTQAQLSANEQALCAALIAACQAVLSEPAFMAAWATGRSLTLVQAIDLALQSTRSTRLEIGEPQIDSHYALVGDTYPPVATIDKL
jgi:predicted ATPase/DNA-binding SARP family transcriptional activator